MTDTGIRTITHETRRLIVPLALPYDAAIHRFEQLVPVADTARFEQLASWNAVLDLADINGPHGFMIYWKADVTAAMALSDSGWKCTEYLMGNHTIAQRMFRHVRPMCQGAGFVPPVGRTPCAVQQWLTWSALFTTRLSLTAEQRNSRSRA